MQQKHVEKEQKDDSVIEKPKPVNEQIGEGVGQAVDKTEQVVDKAKQEVARSSVPWYRASKRAYALIGFYAIEAVLFAVLAWFVHVHPVIAIDVTITREFQENQAPWLRITMFAVSWLGFQPILFPILILLTAIAFWLLRLRLEAIIIVALSAVSSILNGVIKVIVERPRPTAKLVDILYAVGGQSFPSGHVMAYVAYFGLLFSFGLILLKRDRWWHYAILIIPALFVILVGPSRIYLGDHWASDVLGAYLISGFLLGITLWIYLKLKERKVLALKRKR